jgi:hypothetical protein
MREALNLGCRYRFCLLGDSRLVSNMSVPIYAKIRRPLGPGRPMGSRFEDDSIMLQLARTVEHVRRWWLGRGYIDGGM